ncbi:ankyrin repeat protein [Leptospira phage vB_LbrZ_5399-LE1]|uniref:Ankyrin repeat domain-containing protein n=1 Tax=Leptospira inadai serovar Lyme TaxID=293084 RepID=A0ABX4YGD6_9LEPT|nr:ankyrin repeat domain-containing protein [Leptospira inadai]AGS80769.1 ankyrin repeat protein [Leptospira phage vB_LbrZ_5399-LE1]AGS80874.1 ankyrin repeat protein [Leptospira phage vB_LinZ_10-LE1]PNV74322.1 ankyrin repeat domain-containing protein [Leptospira inadai serovar Lyme]
MKRYLIIFILIPIISISSRPIDDLLIASKNGDVRKIESILKKGNVDVNGFIKGSLPTEEEEAEVGFQFTPLHWAVKNNHVEAVKVLIKAGANVNAVAGYSKETPIFFTLNPKKKDILNLLISAKADLSVLDSSGQTPLNSAVRYGYFKTSKILIELGSDINHKNIDGETPLHNASSRGYDEIVELLISKGAGVNLVTKKSSNIDSGGNSPLHYAAMFGRVNTVKILLSHGANKTLCNGDGNTPLDIAKKEGYKDLIKILE